MSHYYKNPWCDACNMANARRIRKLRQASGRYLGEIEFGKRFTFDTLVATSEISKGLNGERFATTIRDLGTDFIDAVAAKSKDSVGLDSSMALLKAVLGGLLFSESADISDIVEGIELADIEAVEERSEALEPMFMSVVGVVAMKNSG